MSIYTVSELNTKIISAKAAIDAVLLAKEYLIDTGQSKQKVTREDLPNLRIYLNELEGRLDELSGTGGLQYINPRN